MAREKPYREEWWDRDRVAKLDRALQADTQRRKAWDPKKMSIIVDFGEDGNDGFSRLGPAIQHAKQHCATGEGYIDGVPPSRREAAVLVYTESSQIVVYRCQNNALIRADWRPKYDGWVHSEGPGYTGRYKIGPNRLATGRFSGARRRAAERDVNAFLVR